MLQLAVTQAAATLGGADLSLKTGLLFTALTTHDWLGDWALKR